MKAVVMAGGKGTRLRPLTDTEPKPLVPIGGKPVLFHILRLLRKHGVSEAVIACGACRKALESAAGSLCEGISLSYMPEETPLGTAGSVGLCRDFLSDGDFFVISGDAMCDLDLSAAKKLHREKNAMATLIVTRVPDPTEYGMIVTDKEGRIISFVEKPAVSQACCDTVNTGIYVLSPEIFGKIPEGSFCDFGHDLFPSLLSEGKSLFAAEVSGVWRDIGSPEEYLKANLSYAAEHPAYLPEGVTNSVLGKNVFIGKNVGIQDSVLMDGVTVGSHSRIRGTILCRNVTVGCDVTVADGCVLGEGAKVGDHASLGYGTVLTAKEAVESGTVTRSGEERNYGKYLRDDGFYGDSDALDTTFLTVCGYAAAQSFAALPENAGKPEKIGVMCRGGIRSDGTETAELCRGVSRAGGQVICLGAGFEAAAADSVVTLGLSGVIFLYKDRTNRGVRFFDRFGLPPGRAFERTLLLKLRAEESFESDSFVRPLPAEKCDYLLTHYGPKRRSEAGVLSGIQVSFVQHAGMTASSASGVLCGILTEAGADIREDASLLIDLPEDGRRVTFSENGTEADENRLRMLLMTHRAELFQEPLPFSCRVPEEVVRYAERMGFSCLRYSTCPSGSGETEKRRRAAEEPLLTDALRLTLETLRLLHDTGETLSQLIDSLPPFFTWETVLPWRGVHATALRGFGTPAGDGVWKDAPGGGVRIIPEKNRFRIIAEGISAEYAAEISADALKTLKKLLSSENGSDTDP